MPKLATRVVHAAEPLPPELRRLVEDTPALTVLLGRREFLKAAGVLAAALAIPFTGVRRALRQGRGRFFTRPSARRSRPSSIAIISPTRDPGARALGRRRLHRAAPHRLDQGGSRSSSGGRSATAIRSRRRRGRPSRRRPSNSSRASFADAPPDAALQAELFGSAAVPGATFNDATPGHWSGLRQIYRDGLAKGDQVATADEGAAVRAALAHRPRRRAHRPRRGVFPVDRRRGTTFLDVVITHARRRVRAARVRRQRARAAGGSCASRRQPAARLPIYSTDKTTTTSGRRTRCRRRSDEFRHASSPRRSPPTPLDRRRDPDAHRTVRELLRPTTSSAIAVAATFDYCINGSGAAAPSARTCSRPPVTGPRGLSPVQTRSSARRPRSSQTPLHSNDELKYSIRGWIVRIRSSSRAPSAPTRRERLARERRHRAAEAVGGAPRHADCKTPRFNKIDFALIVHYGSAARCARER